MYTDMYEYEMHNMEVVVLFWSKVPELSLSYVEEAHLRKSNGMLCTVLYTVLKFFVIHYHHGTTRGSYVESISLGEDSNDHLVAKWWLEKCISMMMMTLHNMYLVAACTFCKISLLLFGKHRKEWLDLNHCKATLVKLNLLVVTWQVLAFVNE